MVSDDRRVPELTPEEIAAINEAFRNLGRTFTAMVQAMRPMFVELGRAMARAVAALEAAGLRPEDSTATSDERTEEP